jgi:hypothetical protein
MGKQGQQKLMRVLLINFATREDQCTRGDINLLVANHHKHLKRRVYLACSLS